MEFDVIADNTRDYFVNKVNNKLKQGWKLEGNLQSNRTAQGVEWFAQAMTREIKQSEVKK